MLEKVGAPSTVINLGTGDGVTVRELLAVFEKVFGGPVPTVDAPPAPGDAVGAYANVDKARDVLGWHPELTVEEASSRRWPGARSARGAGLRVSPRVDTTVAGETYTRDVTQHADDHASRRTGRRRCARGATG